MIDPSRVAIVTRSYHDELYHHCESFLTALPFQRYRLQNVAADTYFYALHHFDVDWVINIDEDAYLFQPKHLLSLLDYMAENAYQCCGMPDGGVLPIRQHNPLVPNAFFTIHHVAAIREQFQLSDVLECKFDEDLLLRLPKHLLRSKEYQFDEFEPYYRYFFWLLRSGMKILYLSADEWKDGISTVLRNHENQAFLLHCWYAREFESQRERFMEAIEACRSGFVLHSEIS